MAPPWGVRIRKGVSTALAEYLAKHRAAKVTERLGAVYSAEAGKVHAAVRRTEQRVLRRVEW